MKIKKRSMRNGRGQLSMDLSFAIILVFVIISSLLSYSKVTTLSASLPKTRMVLNTVSDHITSNLHILFNEVQKLQTGEITYNLTLPDTYSNDDSKSVAVDYSVDFSHLPHTLILSSGGISIQRSLGISLVCTPPVGSLSPGSTLILKDCKREPDGIKCTCLID